MAFREVGTGTGADALERRSQLGALTIAAAKHLGGDTMMVDENKSVRELQMARINGIVLIDHPAKDSGPRCINCYFTAAQDF